MKHAHRRIMINKDEFDSRRFTILSYIEQWNRFFSEP